MNSAQINAPSAPERQPTQWRVETTWNCHGRNVIRGTELTIDGESGRFKFLRLVTKIDDPKVQWIDVFGGRKGYETIRSFRPGRVHTVHYIAKMRPTVAKGQTA